MVRSVLDSRHYRWLGPVHETYICRVIVDLLRWQVYIDQPPRQPHNAK